MKQVYIVHVTEENGKRAKVIAHCDSAEKARAKYLLTDYAGYEGPYEAGFAAKRYPIGSYVAADDPENT